MRRVRRANARRCGHLHELTGERVNVPAHVQLWVHGVWSVYMQCRYCNRRDVLSKSVRRVRGANARRCGHLHELTSERVNVPANV